MATYINGRRVDDADDYDGDIGDVVIKNVTGPVVIGGKSKVNVTGGEVNVTGPGAVYVAGDNPGGIHRSYRKNKNGDWEVTDG